MATGTYEVLRRNLSRARGMLARGCLSLWLLRAITLVAVTLFLSTALVLLVGTESLVTAGLGVLVVFCLPVLVLSAIVVPLLRVPTLEGVAVMADRLEGDKNTLISSYQLGRRVDELSPFYSREIIQAIVSEGEALSKTLDFRKLLPARKLWSWAIACILATLALVALLAFVPGAYEPSFSSIISRPFEETVSIAVKPGDIEVEPGEAVRVQVSVKGSLSVPRLRIKPGSAPWSYVALRRASGSERGLEESVFDATIRNIEMSTQYTAELGKTQTAVYRISVRTPPEVSEFLIAYEFPQYAGVEKRVVRSLVGDISALLGTKVRLEAEFSRDVSSAGLLLDDGKVVAMEPRSDRGFAASFPLIKGGTYHVFAADARGGKYLSPLYEISCQEDLSPFIKLVSPSSEVDLDENMQFPLEVVCADDYGLTRLLLHYYKDPQDVRSEEIKSFRARTKEAAVTHFWDLGSLQLLPGETVSYFLEVLDNDVISGPKSTRTPLMTARFPTLAELYSGMEEQQDERIVDLQQILDEAQRMKEELQKASRELKQESGLSWERKKEMENLAKTYTGMAESIDQITQALEADVEKLQGYDPASFELAQKIQEVKKLLEAINSPELNSAIERLHQALSKLDLRQLENSLGQCTVTQEELLKGLDRAIELLKQIKLEEKLQAAVEKAAELAQKQGEVSQKLDEKEPDLQKASEEQSDIGQSLESLKRELEELAKETPNKDLTRALEDILDSISKTGLQEDISTSTQMMCSKKTSGLKRLVHKIEGGLSEVVDQLTRAQQSSSSKQLADVTEKVRRAMHELVRLSKEQEELSMCSGREPAQELAMREQGILEGTSSVADRLFEISKETFFMNQATASGLGVTLKKMEKALRSFEGNVKGDGLWTSREAYQSLNSVLASLLLTEQQMCSGQGAGMGSGQGFQRMRSLGGLQQGINRATQELYSAMSKQGRLSRSDEEALGQLAARQEMVRKGMEEVSKAIGQRRDILGRLDEIIEDMKNVEERMGTKQLDQDLVHRQNQILSRLLDAQRSVQQQDYSGKRYSRPGRDFPDRQSPPELPRELLGRAEKIRLDMLREKTDRYPESYRELVEQYMRALSRSTK